MPKLDRTSSSSLFLACLLGAVLLLPGCPAADPAADSAAATGSASTATPQGEGSGPSLSAAFLPEDEKTLMIIGQDLASVREYSASDCCPVPGGVTTYLSLYKILDPAHQFGGMGIDASGAPLDTLAEWGAGVSSLYLLMEEYPDSAIAIGLSIVENEHPGALGRLIGGEYDREIEHLVGLISRHPRPVYMRIGYEFDGMWNQGYEDRQQYIDAYRKVAEGLKAAGAENVALVWQGSASPTDDSIEGGHEDITEWYPGDEYVDWVGLSWFLVPDVVGTQSSVQVTQNQLADELVAFARERGKPVMIAESTPQAYDLEDGYEAHHSPVWDGVAHTEKRQLGGEEIWTEWFEPFFEYIRANRDVIRAVAYINAHWDAQAMWSENDYASGYWGDSRVQVNPEIRQRWQQELSKEYWAHGGGS